MLHRVLRPPALVRLPIQIQQKRTLFSMWDRVRPSFWHPMATIEQSLMEVDRMANQMLTSARFPFPHTLLPHPSDDEDDFFKDLPVKAPKQTPKTKHSKEKSAKTSSKSHEEQPVQSFSSYSYSSSTVLDENGHQVSTVRRRYEDSTGRLKAVHEREIDGKRLKTIWSRKQKDDEGEHHTLCSSGSAHAFEEEWKKTPFGQVEAQHQLRNEQSAKPDERHDRPAMEAPKDYTFGSDPQAAEKAPPKEHLSKAAEGVTEEAHRKSREQAIAQGSKNQAEETTPPQYG